VDALGYETLARGMAKTLEAARADARAAKRMIVIRRRMLK
jgi:hypothetical protein